MLAPNKSWMRGLFPALAAFAFSVAAPAATIEQIISREDPAFNCAQGFLSVGRDGKVYVCSSGNNSYVLRLNRDGSDKIGAPTVYAVGNVTANAAGTLASANGHFAHKVALYRNDFTQYAEVTDFLVSDQVGWNAPLHVEAGASGDFYGCDLHRGRILRITPAGKVAAVYAMPPVLSDKDMVTDFRVCEKTESFYLTTRTRPLHCVAFSGAVRWTLDVGVGWFGEGPRGGGFDVDDNGVLYVLRAESDTIQKFSAEGKPAGEIKLQMGEFKPNGVRSNSALYVFDKDVIVQPRQHQTELFQCYDLATGALKKSVTIDYERLTVACPAEIWTAGQPVPFKIDFNPGARQVKPIWHVWARPVGALAYREFPLAGDQLRVPADGAGLYQFKVTPEAQPWQRGKVSEYLVRGVVEIRQPNTTGSASVLTPQCRVSYGRGEEIPFSVIVRAAGSLPPALTVRLLDGARVLAEGTTAINAGTKEYKLSLSRNLTAGLKPGSYLLAVQASGLTGVPQYLVIGPGRKASNNFYTIQYSEGFNFPPANVWDAPDVSSQTVYKFNRLGATLMIDRMGTEIPNWLTGVIARDKDEVKAIVERLTNDPQAVAPEKALPGPNYFQTIAGYGASGIQQMAVLTGMDAGVSFGTGLWPKSKDTALAEVKLVTESLQPFPAFRGWIWAVNWWIYSGKRQDSAATPEQKTAFVNALKQANETGQWNPVLDQVADTWLNLAVDTQGVLGKQLEEIAPKSGLVTSVAGCCRNPDCYPPTTFSNVDEVDLYAQWEQMAPPYFSPFSVDFYQRPGKLSWGHPEVWNDSGNGDQVLTTLFSMVMRGANGVGNAEGPLPWGPQAEDPRLSYQGTNSVYRAMHSLLRSYGPWLNTLVANDRLAIVVSSRMAKVDDWKTGFGLYFGRLFEGYMSLMHAHQPASVLFSEDLKPDTLKRFKAVLVIGQRYEMEPKFAQALADAKTAGVPLFTDGTCRPEFVTGATPLGVSFDHFEKERHFAGDDSSYWRYRQVCLDNAPAIAKALNGVVPPVADIANPEVFACERTAGDGRFLFVLNHTTPLFDPGQLWRVALVVSTRVPVVEPIGLATGDKAVYDVFALKPAAAQGGKIPADLRSLPFRIFAILPSGIGRVELSGPATVTAGQSFAWKAQVTDRVGAALKTTVPVRIRLLDAQNNVLDEQFTFADAAGASGIMTACLNATDRQTLEVTELFSGKTTSLPIAVSQMVKPETIGEAAAAMATPAPPSKKASGENPGALAPAEGSFGPHIRDITVLENGSLAIVNTMNWDNNLYALDLASGKVSWRKKIGHAFAFDPRKLDQGLAIQGFDLNSVSGYCLYLLGADGQASRRFELYGLPRRATQRFVPGMLNDRMNNFAAPASGAWVACSGDLGLAVWDKSGKLLWSQDWWKTNRRQPRVTETQNFQATRLVTPILSALDAQTLLVCDGLKATAYAATTGKERWKLDLAPAGEVTKIVTAADGKTVFILATTYGGRIFVIREGKLVTTLLAGGNYLDVSANGSLVVVADGQILKLYSLTDGLQWTFAGDDVMRFPRFSPDAKRLVATSDLGSVYVLGLDGKTLFEGDLGGLAVPAWLANGDLILGTWMGRVCRLDAKYAEVWATHLAPEASDIRDKLLADDGVPTSRVEGWGNAAATPLPLTPNLLATYKPIVSFFCRKDTWEFSQSTDALFDGKADPPAKPWLDWANISWLGEGPAFNYLCLDTFRTQLEVNAITLVEDPAHPESWVRDAFLEYWDVAKEQWVFVQYLLANAPVHTHLLAKPVSAARFRLVMPPGLVGNLRLAEIVFHGQALGASHPDVLAKRPVAVLFDEGEDLKDALISKGCTFGVAGAYSGNRCLLLEADKVVAPVRPPHLIANWDFEIVEKPEPGQYRYAQFAWKATAAQTRGISLFLAATAMYVGERSPNAMTGGGEPKQVGTAVPTDWQLVRVDLWDLFKRPTRIQSMWLGCVGGGAAFDQILLGRSEKDLDDGAKKPEPGKADE